MLDETDIRIVRKMQENSRMSFKKLAEELDLSVDTVIRRYNNLKESGKIKVSITVNSGKIGLTESDWHFISLKPESDMAAVIDKLSKIKGVTAIHSAIGNYDLLLETLHPSYVQAREVERKILQMPEIYRVITRIYYIPEIASFPLSRPWLNSFLMIGKTNL